MSFVDFICGKLKTRNWVVARRTARIVRKYGDDVVCLSQKKYSAIFEEYKTQT